MLLETGMDVRDAAWLIAKRHPNGLSQLRLLKLLYLAELRHYERHGTRLTNADWFRHDYGPFSKTIATLLRKNIVTEGEWLDLGGGKRMLSIKAKGPGPEQVGEDERASLEDTLWFYEDHTTDEIVQDVYEDPFFENTPFSNDFDFSKIPASRLLNLTEEELRQLDA